MLLDEFVEKFGGGVVAPFEDILNKFGVPLSRLLGQGSDVDIQSTHIVTGDGVGYALNGDFEIFTESAFVFISEPLSDALRHQADALLGFLEIVGYVTARRRCNGADMNETKYPAFIDGLAMFYRETKDEAMPVDTAIGLAAFGNCEVSNFLFSGLETETLHEELEVSLLKMPGGIGISKSREYVGFVKRRLMEASNRPRT